MKKFVSSALAVSLMIPGLLFSVSALAASSYKFTARGIVTAVNVDQKTYTIAITHVSGTGATDLAGASESFSASSAKIYKKNTAGKNVRVTLKNVAAGSEVSIWGVKRSDGTFALTQVQVADSSFSVIGTVKDVDRTLKTYTVTVTSSTYKNTSYKAKDVVFQYDSNTKFKFHSATGADRNADEVGTNNQRVKLSGTVTNGDQWEVATFIDEYTGK